MLSVTYTRAEEHQLTSGSSVDEFKVTPERERAFQDLLRNARQLRGWSQQEVERASRDLGLPLNQTLISSLERGPYPGMRLWDVYKLCRVYSLPVSQVMDALGWSEGESSSKTDRRVNLICNAIRDLAGPDLDTILNVVEKYVVGTRHAHE
jgi:hypothetical protein